MKLSEALEILTTTYQSLDFIAKDLPVDANEVKNALAKSDPNTAEGVSLAVLAKYQPDSIVEEVKEFKPEIKIKENKNDSTDQVE
jgi:hypothetical protein